MIISASRRTDIPAFYAEWFINRIRSGYCTVPNPFNRKQISRISLRPADVDVIVFWTRNPRPLFPYLDELDQKCLRYYFQYTLVDNPRQIDPKSPAVERAINTFKELSHRIGAERVIWRYDPIVITSVRPSKFHIERYEHIAHHLAGYTRRSVISFVDEYAKARKRLAEMGKQGAVLQSPQDIQPSQFDDLLQSMVSLAEANGMEITSCAEELDLARYGIQAGKCIDDRLIKRVFGLDLDLKKDPNQREACGCAISKDIGMYDSCLFGCQYCYANSSFGRARFNYDQHDLRSPSMIGWYDVEDKNDQQLSLF